MTLDSARLAWASPAWRCPLPNGQPASSSGMRMRLLSHTGALISRPTLDTMCSMATDILECCGHVSMHLTQ